VQQVFDKHAQAVGGRAAWQKVTSRVSRGIVEIEGQEGSGKFVVYERAPDRHASTVTLPNGIVLHEGFDGKAAWEDDPKAGVHNLKGTEAEDSRATADFYEDVELENVYRRAKVIGQQLADGRQAFVVEAAPKGGYKRLLYFDVETGLRFRTDVFRNPLSFEPTSVLRLDDYREIDGIKVPYHIRYQIQGTSMLLRFTAIRHNVTVGDDQLARPLGSTAAN
jgi:hypothetical protein